MARYRIRIDKMDSVPDRLAKWQRGAKKDGDGDGAYVMPPEGAMREVNETVFDQVVEELDLAGLARAINTPGAFNGA